MFGNEIRSVVPWSRLFDGEEVLCAINTDSVQARTVWSVIDHDLHRPGEHFRCAYSTDAVEIGTQLPVEDRGPTRALHLTVPAAGFVIYEKTS
jgi:hypothetical protein